MRNASHIQVIDINKRGEDKVVRFTLPNSARKVKKIVITNKLTGAVIQRPLHYVTMLDPGATPLVTDFSIQKEFETNTETFAINCPANKHVYYARPSRISNHPAFEINGQTVSFSNPTQQTYTDTETGHTEEYNVYESFNDNFGISILQVS